MTFKTAGTQLGTQHGFGDFFLIVITTVLGTVTRLEFIRFDDKAHSCPSQTQTQHLFELHLTVLFW